MTTVNVIATIRMLAVNGQSKTGHQLKGTFGNDKGGGVIRRLWTAIIGCAGHRQHRHVHRNRTEEVQKRHYQKDSSHHNKSRK